MRKRKAPVAAVFFLALLLAIVAFFNMQTSKSGTPGVYDTEREQAEMDAQRSAPPDDTTRRQAMEQQLGGPVAPKDAVPKR